MGIFGDLFAKKGDPNTTPMDSRPTVGSVNVLETSVGQRGTGKSTWQCMRANELCHEWGGAYVLGHSLGGRLPSKLPDGTELPITYYETLMKLEAGIRKHPERWHILAPPINLPNKDTADDLLRFSVRFTDGVRKAAWEKAHPFAMKKWKSSTNMEGIHATPTIVIIDEGIAIESAGSTKKDSNRWFYEYLFSLRHYHMAMFYSIQDPNARTWQLLGQSREIYVFNTRHRYALECIRAAGATDEEMERIKSLPTPKQLEKGERTHDHVQLALEGPVGAPPPFVGVDVLE